MEKEPDSNVCPVCSKKLVQIYYEGPDPVVPPDIIFEGFVDPGGWYEVKTSVSDTNEYYRFDYASTRTLNEILKGLVSAT